MHPPYPFFGEFAKGARLDQGVLFKVGRRDPSRVVRADAGRNLGNPRQAVNPGSRQDASKNREDLVDLSKNY
jgi:hypothetical protein